MKKGEKRLPFRQDLWYNNYVWNFDFLRNARRLRYVRSSESEYVEAYVGGSF